MRDAVRDVIKQSLADLAQQQRRQWVLNWPGQAVLTVSQIDWTSGAVAAIQGSGLRGLRVYEQTLNKGLDAIVKLVRGELTAMQRLTLGALVVIDVHARDAISKLVHAGVEMESNFEWQSQVRCAGCCGCVNDVCVNRLSPLLCVFVLNMCDHVAAVLLGRG